MIDLLLQPHNLPFLVAGGFVLLFALLEGALLLLGLSSDALLGHGHDGAHGLDHHGGAHGVGHDIHPHDHAEGGFLSWLGFGRVPFAVLLIALCAGFAGFGLLVQGLARGILGGPLHWALASIPALAAALPVTRVATVAIARLVPREQSYVASRDSLLGRIAVVVQGTATAALPAEARVPDGFGGSLYVTVVPEAEGAAIPAGTRVVLLSRTERAFVVAPARDDPVAPAREDPVAPARLP
ncbi:YqiJ family protein [Roseomonas hellenica]|uniref:YqiJ family protein n=1 Tax=Plastoroseomonas hellenica TaxID=2687306 RepID=A0ABS5F1X1_9PROT|nr:OB-fold-containig protein [Plastoroseomonas hellenica]MBR0666521.1 YqiJ family protein [Plastoroseomonas hellenica]